MDNFISIGKIVNFHGVNGEAKVAFTKGKEAQISSYKLLYFKKDSDFKTLNVQNIRFHKGFALIKFKEFKSLNEIADLKGQILYVTREEVNKHLENDEFFIDDLIGLDVYNLDEKLIGKIDSVTNANGEDLFSVKNNAGKLFFVPFVKELVPTVDVKNKKVIVNNIEGLIDEV